MGDTGNPPAWRRSSYCNATECLEVAATEHGVLLRRAVTGEPSEGTILRVTAAEWAAFQAAVRDGEFTDLASPSRG